MKTVLLVFRKELRDMFRDKRVRSSAIFGPMMVMFLIIGLLGFVSNTVKKKQGQKVYVVRTTNPAAAQLQKSGAEIVDVASLDEGKKLIQEGKAKIVLNFQPPKADGQTEVDAYVDPKEQLGQLALGTVETVYRATNKASLTALLTKNGLSANADEAIKVVKHEVQVGETGGASEFLIGFLPYLIVVYAFYGAMSIASDLVAGEKEKNTLETLLISPARRTQIVLGKFLALSVVGLMSSMACLVGLTLASNAHLPGTEEILKNGLGVTPTAFLVTLAVLLPLVAFFASMLVAVSSYAKNPREAQTYLAQFSLVVIMPAMFSQFIGLTDAAHALWVNFVPILNAANGIRMALMGKVEAVPILLTIATSLVLALLALRVTVKLFNREEVLVRV